jgi:uncharacterized membrane protein
MSLRQSAARHRASCLILACALALPSLPALAQHGQGRGGPHYQPGPAMRGPAYPPRGYGAPGWRGGEYWRGHETSRGYGPPVIAAPLLGLGLGALLGGALLAPRPQYVTPPGVYYPPGGKPGGYGGPPPTYYGY